MSVRVIVDGWQLGEWFRRSAPYQGKFLSFSLACLSALGPSARALSTFKVLNGFPSHLPARDLTAFPPAFSSAPAPVISLFAVLQFALRLFLSTLASLSEGQDFQSEVSSPPFQRDLSSFSVCSVQKHLAFLDAKKRMLAVPAEYSSPLH